MKYLFLINLLSDGDSGRINSADKFAYNNKYHMAYYDQQQPYNPNMAQPMMGNPMAMMGAGSYNGKVL